MSKGFENSEVEYTISNPCYVCCSGGGHRKIKLYKDEIAYEQTCPNPWVCSLCVGFWAGGGYGCPILCPILYFCTKGWKTVVRKPYTKLDAVELNEYDGDCCECCCSSTFFIKGLFGQHASTPMAAVSTNEIFSKVKMVEMCSEISKKVAEAEQHAGQKIAPMQAVPAGGVPVEAPPKGAKFDTITGQPIPKFDPKTGQQNWGFDA